MNAETTNTTGDEVTPEQSAAFRSVAQDCIALADGEPLAWATTSTLAQRLHAARDTWGDNAPDSVMRLLSQHESWEGASEAVEAAWIEVRAAGTVRDTLAAADRLRARDFEFQNETEALGRVARAALAWLDAAAAAQRSRRLTRAQQNDSRKNQ